MSTPGATPITAPERSGGQNRIVKRVSTALGDQLTPGEELTACFYATKAVSFFPMLRPRYVAANERRLCLLKGSGSPKIVFADDLAHIKLISYEKGKFADKIVLGRSGDAEVYALQVAGAGRSECEVLLQLLQAGGSKA